VSCGTGTINVAVYQPIVPQYRESLFQGLHRHPEITLQVFASESGPRGRMTCNLSPEFHLRIVPFHSILDNRVSWQSRLFIPPDFQKGDVIVICGNPRHLTNYRLIWQAKRRGIGVVWWGHGFRARGRLSDLPKCAVYRLLHRLVDVVLLYTDEQVDNYRRLGFCPSNLFATNNALDQSQIARAVAPWGQKELATFRRSEQICNKHVLLVCGRLVPRAKVELTLAAMTRLVETRRDFVLIVIGDGDKRQDLTEMAERLGVGNYVRFLGAIYDEARLAPWFMSADCVVHAGCIGLSLLHAFGYGVPVITHDNSHDHAPEIAAMRHGGNGLLYREGDVVSLANSIATILDNVDLRQRLSEGALHAVKEKYNMENMLTRFLAAIRAASRLKMPPSVHGNTAPSGISTLYHDG
jgi:glycosyltransferase involved in cell wall biosynthesis